VGPKFVRKDILFVPYVMGRGGTHVPSVRRISNRNVMMRLVFRIIAFWWCVSCAFAADITNWEARIPAGSENDPIAISKAFGEADPTKYIDKELRDKYVLDSDSFIGFKPFTELMPKAPNADIYRVALGRGWRHRVWPDQGGVGPFFLVKYGSSYYALTKGNFARCFGPIEKETEILPYLRAYEYLFGNKFTEIVTEEVAKKLSTMRAASEAPKPGQPAQTHREINRVPPKLTKITKVKNGYRVTLITYSRYHIEAFFEKTVLVSRNGIVTVEKPERILKKIGDGIVF
jgi:hypothetical protein